MHLGDTVARTTSDAAKDIGAWRDPTDVLLLERPDSIGLKSGDYGGR